MGGGQERKTMSSTRRTRHGRAKKDNCEVVTFVPALLALAGESRITAGLLHAHMAPPIRAVRNILRTAVNAVKLTANEWRTGLRNLRPLWRRSS